jgi:dTDP-glucose 4,6-dehydratase
MKILITGGAGFQGSHLAEFLLKKGHTVSILNTYSARAKKNLFNILNSADIIWGSVTDKEIVEKSVREHDVVFHLAGRVNVDESLLDPLAFLKANVIGTFNILEAVKHNKNRLILASTCEVYGDGHDLAAGNILTEDAELKPNSPYAASKAGADRLSYSYFKSFDIDLTIVRPFNIYGERQKDSRFGALIPIIVAKAMRGEDLIIFGDGNAERDYCNIDDLVQAYDIILNNKNLKGKVVNFASGKSTSVNDIVKYIAKKFDANIVHKPARPGEVKRFPADISLAKSLGFSPKVSIWEGIDRYIEWAKKEEEKQD